MTDIENPSDELKEAMLINPSLREWVEKTGQVWTTEELQQDFNVIGFQAPHVAVVRRADNVDGTLAFNARPRFYYGWVSAG